MSDGLVDTNVFVHALARDSFSQECRRFLALVEHGTLLVSLDPLVLHELSYTVSRFAKQMSRNDVADYLLSILAWPGIQADKDLLADAVRRWQSNPGLGFVDAYLAARGARDQLPVFTKNLRDFRGHGVDVPDPLPSQS